MKKLSFIILFVLFAGCLFAQSTTPRSTQVIIQELRDNNQRMSDYIEDLKSLNEDKDVTIEELKGNITFVTNKLDSEMEEKAEREEFIIEQNIKLKTQTKWLALLSSILIFFLLAHIIIVILNLKFGIKLPYLLNSIL